MANTTSDSSVKEHLLSESDWSDALEEESHWPDQKRSRTLLWSLAFNVVLVLVLAFVCILTYWPRGNSYHIPGEIYCMSRLSSAKNGAGTYRSWLMFF